MSEPLHTVNGTARLYLGDCVEVMRGLPECSVDTVLCDPPYNLSSSKGSADCLRRILAEVDLPDDCESDAGRTERGNLAPPSLFGSALGGERGAVGELAGVGVPEGAVHLQRQVVPNHEVNAGSEPPALSANSDLAAVLDADGLKLAGDFILEPGDRGDAPFCDGSCSCFAEPAPGRIAVPVVVALPPGGDGAANGVPVDGGGADIATLHDPRGEPEAPPEWDGPQATVWSVAGGG